MVVCCGGGWLFHFPAFMLQNIKGTNFFLLLGLTDWCDHWKQCVWFIPGTGMSVSRDEQIFLEALHSETSISYNVRNANPRLEVDPRFYNSGHHLTLLPERIAIYGDREWRHDMLKAARSAVRTYSCIYYLYLNGL